MFLLFKPWNRTRKNPKNDFQREGIFTFLRFKNQKKVGNMSDIFQTINQIFNLSDIISDFIKKTNYLNAQGEPFPFVPSNSLFDFLGRKRENSNLAPQSSNVFQDLLMQNQTHSALLNFFNNSFDDENLNFSFDSKMLEDFFAADEINFKNNKDFVFNLSGEHLLNQEDNLYFGAENRNKPSFKNVVQKKDDTGNTDVEKIKNIIFQDETIDWIGKRISQEIKEASLNRSIL